MILLHSRARACLHSRAQSLGTFAHSFWLRPVGTTKELLKSSCGKSRRVWCVDEECYLTWLALHMPFDPSKPAHLASWQLKRLRARSLGRRRQFTLEVERAFVLLHFLCGFFYRYLLPNQASCFALSQRDT